MCDQCDSPEDDLPDILTKRHGNGNYTAHSPDLPFLLVRDKSHRKAFESYLDYWWAVMDERN